MGKTPEVLLEEEDPYLKGVDKESYTEDQFLKTWSDFAAKLKAEGKKNLLTIFTSNAPKLLGSDNYEIIVENKVQENYFRDERPNLHNFLRAALKNYSIEVSVRVDEKAVVKRPYTSSEKFQHMAAKNPSLVDLKNKFNLDFD
jgi:DNA polymerase-3 subunit gamma/tau